jgi:ubiquinone/menaquinone biosynthesis C-methylase UbiE
MHIDPHIPVIVNDIEPRILALWRDHLAEAVPGNNVIPAAFDAAASPLRDDSVPCVSSCGGLGSIESDKGSAISEAFRVLVPGGCLVALEMSFTEETLRNLPAPLRSDWRDDPTIASNGWPAALEERGFQVIRDTVTEGRQLHAPFSLAVVTQ